MKKFLFFTLLCILLPLSTLYAKEEVVQSLIYKEGIPWETMQKPYDAQLDLIRVSPTTPENEGDSLRISFSRYLGYTDKKQTPPKKITYHQTWQVTTDSLAKVSVLSTYKILIDGVYQRDSVAITEYKYRVYGPMVLKQYDFRENNVPSGRADETEHKGYSYFPISEEFFNWLRNLNSFPISERSEKKISLFDDVVNHIGSDSIYTVTIDKNNKITAKVMNNRMEITFIENNRPNKFVFSRAYQSHVYVQYLPGNFQYSLYPGEGNKSPCIIINKDKVILQKTNSQKSYIVDASALLKAIRLAKIRQFLVDDDAKNSLLDYYDDLLDW